jgi:hypothetical protein
MPNDPRVDALEHSIHRAKVAINKQADRIAALEKHVSSLLASVDLLANAPTGPGPLPETRTGSGGAKKRDA